MLLNQITEMARPAKICPECGKSMAGNHYWYKGGWRCKKSNLKDKEEGKAEEKKPTHKPEQKPEHKKPVKKHEVERDHAADDEDVKAAEETRGKKRRAGEEITRADVNDIHADTKAEAREQIDSLFPRASSEQKARAMRIWLALHKG